MKKINVLILLVVLLSGCSDEKSYESFTTSTVSAVIDKMNNSESFLFMITTEDCYSCDMFVEDATDILTENELTIETLNYAEFSNNEMEQLQIAVGSYSSWPTIFYIVEGKVYPISKYEYVKDAEGWDAWLIKTELIKE